MSEEPCFVLSIDLGSVGHWSFGIHGLNEPQEGQP